MDIEAAKEWLAILNSQFYAKVSEMNHLERLTLEYHRIAIIEAQIQKLISEDISPDVILKVRNSTKAKDDSDNMQLRSNQRSKAINYLISQKRLMKFNPSWESSQKDVLIMFPLNAGGATLNNTFRDEMGNAIHRFMPDSYKTKNPRDKSQGEERNNFTITESDISLEQFNDLLGSTLSLKKPFRPEECLLPGYEDLMTLTIKLKMVQSISSKLDTKTVKEQLKDALQNLSISLSYISPTPFTDAYSPMAKAIKELGRHYADSLDQEPLSTTVQAFETSIEEAKHTVSTLVQSISQEPNPDVPLRWEKNRVDRVAENIGFVENPSSYELEGMEYQQLIKHYESLQFSVRVLADQWDLLDRHLDELLIAKTKEHTEVPDQQHRIALEKEIAQTRGEMVFLFEEIERKRNKQTQMLTEYKPTVSENFDGASAAGQIAKQKRERDTINDLLALHAGAGRYKTTSLYGEAIRVVEAETTEQRDRFHRMSARIEEIKQQPLGVRKSVEDVRAGWVRLCDVMTQLTTESESLLPDIETLSDVKAADIAAPALDVIRGINQVASDLKIAVAAKEVGEEVFDTIDELSQTLQDLHNGMNAMAATEQFQEIAKMVSVQMHEVLLPVTVMIARHIPEKAEDTKEKIEQIIDRLSTKDQKKQILDAQGNKVLNSQNAIVDEEDDAKKVERLTTALKALQGASTPGAKTPQNLQLHQNTEITILALLWKLESCKKKMESALEHTTEEHTTTGFTSWKNKVRALGDLQDRQSEANNLKTTIDLVKNYIHVMQKELDGVTTRLTVLKQIKATEAKSKSLWKSSSNKTSSPPLASEQDIKISSDSLGALLNFEKTMDDLIGENVSEEQKTGKYKDEPTESSKGLSLKELLEELSKKTAEIEKSLHIENPPRFELRPIDKGKESIAKPTVKLDEIAPSTLLQILKHIKELDSATTKELQTLREDKQTKKCMDIAFPKIGNTSATFSRDMRQVLFNTTALAYAVISSKNNSSQEIELIRKVMTESTHQGINLDDIHDEKKAERILDALLKHKDQITSVVIKCERPSETLKQKIIDTCKNFTENAPGKTIALQMDTFKSQDILAERIPGVTLEETGPARNRALYTILPDHNPRLQSQTESTKSSQSQKTIEGPTTEVQTRKRSASNRF